MLNVRTYFLSVVYGKLSIKWKMSVVIILNIYVNIEHILLGQILTHFFRGWKNNSVFGKVIFSSVISKYSHILILEFDHFVKNDPAVKYFNELKGNSFIGIIALLEL